MQGLPALGTSGELCGSFHLILTAAPRLPTQQPCLTLLGVLSLHVELAGQESHHGLQRLASERAAASLVPVVVLNTSSRSQA